MQKLIEYMGFKHYYEQGEGAKQDVPVREFMDRIPTQLVLEL